MSPLFQRFFRNRFHRAPHDLESSSLHSSLEVKLSSFHHDSVLASEVIEFLRPSSGMIMLDGTLGGGGHSELMLRAGARVIGTDRDPNALAHARARLASYRERFSAIESNFENASANLAKIGVLGLDGILLDLGVSSHQLDTPERGFSFQREGPLDMRMGYSGQTAADLINTATSGELAHLFRLYGDEPRAIQFASRIVRAREKKPFSTTTELAELIAAGRQGPRHPATRVFQALRIAVNDEICSLERALPDLAALLNPGGRMAIISFHSLEDRIVKHFFRRHSLAEIDDPTWPAPRPNPERMFDLLTPRSVTASVQELAANPRSRSARLRIVEKIPPLRA